MKTKIAKKTFTLLCDDVRKEVGNKYSFMGVYGKKIIVSRIPAVLSKICLVVMLDDVKQDAIFGEVQFRQDGAETIKLKFNLSKKSKDIDVNLILVASPFKIEKAGIITIEIYFFDEEKPSITHKVIVEEGPTEKMA